MRTTSRLWFGALALLACAPAPIWIITGPPTIPSRARVEPIDPLPIRRVVLDAEQFAGEMERVRKGLLVQLPRADFEGRVLQAAQAQAALKQPPRLIEARYRARLEGTALVGTGQWKVIHTGPAAAVLPLDPLNLYLHQPRLENRDAILGDLDGKGPGLLVDQTGPRTLTMDWTARGDLGPDGLHFDLKVPACAVAALELDLPADDRMSVSPDGCLMSGPLPAEKPDRRLWKLGFAGRSQLHVLIRKEDGPGQAAPLVLATLKTSLEITPDLLQAEYQFDLQALRQGVRELVCECDPELRPYQVEVPGLESWVLQTGKPNTLRISLREPLRNGGQLLIRCLAPLEDGPAKDAGGAMTAQHPIKWKCPEVRLTQAVPRGETLVLRLHPDVRIEDWQPNGFRMTEATVDAAGWHVLALTGGGIAPDEAEKGTRSPTDLPKSRPSARLQTRGADYRARVVSWWQVNPEQPTVTTQIKYEVLQGHLFHLPVQLPAGWEVERMDLSPPALLRNWSVKQDAGRTVLTVDLQKSLDPARPIPATDFVPAPPRLTLQLRPAGKQPRATAAGFSPREWSWPFPEVVPIGARWREGVLAIEYDERAYQAVLNTSLVSVPVEEEGPWGKQLPDHFLAYRGRPVVGTFHLQARPTHLRARCRQGVFFGEGRVIVESRLRLEAEEGVPDSLDLLVTAPIADNWSWRTESGSAAVRSFERLTSVDAATPLGVLGAATPIEQVALMAARPWGQHWRLTLTQAPRPEEPISLHFTCDAQRADGDRWVVPLLTVLGAHSMEGEITLHRTTPLELKLESQGLSEASTGTRTSPAWKSFRYGQMSGRLVVFGPLPETSPARVPMVRRAALITQVMPGQLLHLYRFQIENWPDQGLPLLLPGDARFVSARVDGRAIDASPRDETGHALRVVLPAPEPNPVESSPKPRLHSCEVVYTRPTGASSFWDRIDAPAPVLPVEPEAMRRIWRLPPGWQPLDESKFARLPGAADGVAALPSEWLQAFPGRLTSLSRRPEWEVRQRRTIAEAAAGLNCNLAGKTLPLGEALERLAFDLLKDQGPVVIHAHAFRQAGVSVDTPMRFASAPPGEDAPHPWENLSLVYVPCEKAPILTTRRQWETWQTGASRNSDPLDESIAAAVAEAVTFGHDGSGRFRTVAEWLRNERSSASGSRNAEPTQSSGPRDMLSADLPPGWTEWEPVAGVQPEAEMHILRREAVTLAGLALAVAFAGLFALAWRSLAWWRFRLLALWLAAGGLAVCWLPSALSGLAWWPWLTALGVAVVWYLGSALLIPARVNEAVARGVGRVAAAAAVVLFALAGMSGRAAPVGPVEAFTVWLVPAPPDAPEKLTVLVPTELLERLDTLAHPAGGAPRGAVLLSAAYEGRSGDGHVDCNAIFQVHCFEDHGTLALPLAGVHLQEEVLLDGARAYPTAAPPPQGGYTLKVEGRGAHTLRLRFRVPVHVEGDNRDLQFTVPRLVQSRLTLNLPPGIGDPQVPTRLGEQRSAATAEGVHLEADLGRLTTPVAVRWRQESGPARPMVVEAREAYLWELRADAGSLKALIQYRVIQGSTASFELDLPEPLEVRGVEVRAPARGKPVPRLKESTVGGIGAQRRLHLEFQNAVTGDVQVLLDVIPRRSFSSTATLPLPAPRDVRIVQSYLAYSLDGVEARVKDLAHLIGVRVDDFVEFWTKGGEEEPRRLVAAFAITRKADAVPFLRLQLSIPSTPLSGTQDIAWRVGRDHATFQAKARLSAPAGDFALAEWNVPAPLNIALVSGSNVWHWSQNGSRLQVWFHQAVGATEVQLAGWLPLDAGSKDAPPVGLPRFDLPCVRLLATGAQSTSVRIVPARGLRLNPPQLRNLVPLPSTGGVDDEFAYLAREADYGASFPLKSIDTPVDVRVHKTEKMPQRLTPRSASAGSAPVQIFLVEQTASVVDGRTWMHQATGWFYHHAGADLDFALPEGATLVKATIDGVAVVPMRTDSERAWIRLPGEAGARRVTLRWKFDPATEPVDQPNLARPRLDGAAENDYVWTLHVPRGYRVEPSSGISFFATSAQGDLRRAEAQMRLSGALGEQTRGGGSVASGPLASAQQRFYQACRFAEQALAAAPADSADSVWLKTLRDQNKDLAQKLGFERARADAERQVRAGLSFADADSVGGQQDDPLPDQGAPLYGQGSFGASSPGLRLQAAELAQARRNLAVSLVLLCVLLVVGVLSYLPQVLRRVQRFWPEQLALLAALLWLMAGPLTVIAMLLCMAIVGRIVELGVLTYCYVRRRETQLPVAAGTSAS